MAKKLRFGVIGCGGIASKVLPEVMKSPGVEIVAAAASDPRRGKAFCAKFGLAFEPSYAALLKRPDIGAVYVALPESLHAKWSIAAARAGKHVICEKTMAPSYAEARQMVAAAAKHKVRLLEAFMWRFSKAAGALKREAKALGKPRSVHARFGFQMDIGSNYRNFKRFGGGALNDIGCYALSAARFLMGEPLKVQARLTGGSATLADRHGAAWLEFKDGGLGTIEFSFSAQTGQDLVYCTEAGRLEAPGPFTFERKRKLVSYRGWKDGVEKLLGRENHYRLMFEGFAAEVRRSPRRIGAFEREALLQARAMQALRDSAKSGKIITLKGRP